MKILLPSKGILGQSIVHLRIPTFGDLYTIQDHATDELNQKCGFIKLISDANLSKITMDDVEYLFSIVSFALLNNRIVRDVKCENPECGEEYKQAVSLGTQDVTQLKITSAQLPFTKRINLKKYSYTIPSAQDIIDCYDAAQYEEDEERAFMDLKVACIMGHKGDREYAKHLPVSVYAAALVFPEINYHGIDYRFKVVCPKCKHEQTITFGIGVGILNYDHEKILSNFANVQALISLTDFMSLSIRGFNAFVAAMNKKNGQ